MSRYLQSVVMRSRGEGSRLMPMPRSYTRYGTILSDGSENGSGFSRGLEDEERPMGAGLVSRDARRDAAFSRRPADVPSREPGGRSVGEDGESVQRPNGKDRDQRVGGNENRHASAGDPPAVPQTHRADRVRRSVSIGKPAWQPLQNEVISVPFAGTEPLDGPARHIHESARGDTSLSKQGRGVTQVQMQPEARSVDRMRPTLAEALFQRTQGEGPVSRAMDGPPIVRIQIGRIEVKAVHQSAAPPGIKVGEAPRSSLPLDQYLRRGLRET